MSTETDKKEVASEAQAPVVADDVKRGGEKEMATNAEAIVAEKEKEPEVKDVKPSFFIKKATRHVVKMDVLSSKVDGRVVSVSKDGMGIDFAKDFPQLAHTQLTFEFSIPNYEDMSTYRQRSSVFRREIQQTIVDKLQLRNYLLVWHLKDWNMTDEDGKKIELNFDPNGSLTDESLAIVYSISPTLMDVVMTCYEKEILLT